ncbi:MAG: DegQ family serine endoprotease [Formivibrio sp.]|nr:DegQ family serine endoprotease [Formivibrio sp.]
MQKNYPHLVRTITMKKWLMAGLATIGLLATAQAATQGLPDFTQLVEQEGSAVVNISTMSTVKVSGPTSGMDPETLDLFRRFGFPVPPDAGQAQPRERHTQSLGSGFIIDTNGYILTNAHVVADANEITVKLIDKRIFKAKLIGSDTRTDVALLKIEASGLPKVVIGDVNKLKVGEWVVAIGSPFGLENTVTAGIVSAKGRNLPDENFVPFIQTDAAVNPGNSGGPLFNMNGEVIGINSQIYSQSGGYMGLSFAIPVDVAMKVANELKSHGRVQRARIGVTIQDVNDELAKSFGLVKASGALVNSVEKGGPADKVGIKTGDIILKFNGQAVATSSDLPKLVSSAKPGTKATIQIWRDKVVHDLSITLGELDQPGKINAQREPASKPSTEDNGRFGLSLQELTPSQLKTLGIKFGLIITDASGVATKAGLESGDVIVGVGSQDLTSLGQLKQRLAALKANESLPLRILRHGQSLFLVLNAPEK